MASIVGTGGAAPCTYGLLLRSTVTGKETQPRLKYRRPFATCGKDLLSTTLPNETKAHRIAWMWSVERQPSTNRLREYITSPSRSSPGSDLPQQPWVKLGGLRAEVRRFGADVWRWGLSETPAYDCRADQRTANHIITECPLYRPPNDLHGLIDVDAGAAARERLLGKFPEVWLFLLVIRFHTQEFRRSHRVMYSLRKWHIEHTWCPKSNHHFLKPHISINFCRNANLS